MVLHGMGGVRGGGAGGKPQSLQPSPSSHLLTVIATWTLLPEWPQTNYLTYC
jgi:hypothetical protein